MGEEEAKFSKMLATIRRDAPIDFILPNKKWKEDLNIEKAENIFNELEFKNMGTRLKEVIFVEGYLKGGLQMPQSQKAAFQSQKMPFKKKIF